MMRVVAGNDDTLIGALFCQAEIAGAFLALLNTLLAGRWDGNVHTAAALFPLRRAFAVRIFFFDFDCLFVCGAEGGKKLVAGSR